MIYLQITLQSYNAISIFFASKIIQQHLLFFKKNIILSQNCFLPTVSKRYCVLRSPHIDEDAREHFELKTHKCFIKFRILDPINLKILKFLTFLDFRPGIFYTLKLVKQRSIL